MASTTSSRFRSALDEHSLIGVVAEVTSHVRPDAPETVAPGPYDRALKADADSATPRWAGAPSADATRRRLARLAWYELLELIHDPARSTGHYLALRRRRAARSITTDEATAALQLVARALNQDSLRPHEYAQRRDALVAADSRAWAAGGHLDRHLPTAAQVDQAFRPEGEGSGWDHALQSAGLRWRSHATRRGLPPERVVERFLTDIGCLPWGRRALRAYATATSLSLSDLKRPLAEYIDELRRDRDSLAMWTPPHPPPRHLRPTAEMPQQRAPGPDGATGDYQWPDLDVVVEGVAEAYRLAAEQHVNLSQAVHHRLAREHHGRVPAPGLVDRRAKEEAKTAKDVRDRALALHRARTAGTVPARTRQLPAEMPPPELPATGPLPPATRAPRRSKLTEAERIARQRERGRVAPCGRARRQQGVAEAPAPSGPHRRPHPRGPADRRAAARVRAREHRRRGGGSPERTPAAERARALLTIGSREGAHRPPSGEGLAPVGPRRPARGHA